MRLNMNLVNGKCSCLDCALSEAVNTFQKALKQKANKEEMTLRQWNKQEEAKYTAEILAKALKQAKNPSQNVKLEAGTQSEPYRHPDVKTLRDEFAMSYLSGFTSVKANREISFKALANMSYLMADAMIEARNMVKSAEASKG